MPRTNRIGANNLNDQLGQEEADDVRAAIVGALAHISNARASLDVVWDEADTDLARLALMTEDLYQIGRRIGA
jgi:hypothetical protein